MANTVKIGRTEYAVEFTGNDFTPAELVGPRGNRHPLIRNDKTGLLVGGLTSATKGRAYEVTGEGLVERTVAWCR